MTQQSTGKRLAKNSAFMYGRMIVLMLISFYTSRVVLRELGVEDFGIYNVVGSVVAMFSAVRSMFASSTQRFMNYEMGKGNDERLQLVFNTGTFINLLLSIVFIIGVEIVGWWFFKYKINIDPSRLFAAKWVFQISVFTAVIGMMTTPYDAVLIAHERMDFYAIIAIGEGVLRLVVVFLLTVFSYDKLIFYAILQLCISILVRFINATYCKRHFPESHYKRCWDKALFKEMSVFAGWNFFGNMAFTLTESGLNMVLNVFGGATVNAARGISYQIKTATHRFLSSMLVVVNAYNTKTYAAGQKKKFFDLLHFSSKIYFMIQIAMAIPLTYLTKDIMFLWLGQVPEYAVVFTQLVMVHTLLRAVHYPINNLFKAVGDLKAYQIAEGIILSLPLLFSYIALRAGAPYASVFVIIIICEVINFIAIVLIARRVAGLSVRQYLWRTVVPCVICFVEACVGFVIRTLFVDDIWVAIAITAISLILCFLLMFFVGLSKMERQQLLALIKKNKSSKSKA
jgi:O-antigen/teichoic acid export membrane protein